MRIHGPWSVDCGELLLFTGAFDPAGITDSVAGRRATWPPEGELLRRRAATESLRSIGTSPAQGRRTNEEFSSGCRTVASMELRWIGRLQPKSVTKGKHGRWKPKLAQFERLQSGGSTQRDFSFFTCLTLTEQHYCIYMRIGAYILKKHCKNYWVFIAYPWIVLAPPMQERTVQGLIHAWSTRGHKRTGPPSSPKPVTRRRHDTRARQGGVPWFPIINSHRLPRV
jgi:hypothetical protein